MAKVLTVAGDLTAAATIDQVVAAADTLANSIVWLLSDDAANINGVILPSDGGWSAV